MRNLLFLFALFSISYAETTFAPVFTDHAVLQRDIPLRVWGNAPPETEVNVVLKGNDLVRQATARTNAEGAWSVTLDAIPATTDAFTLTARGDRSVTLSNLLGGDVWICSGQSNMSMSLNRCWNADLETAMARHPHMRLLSVLNDGAQKPVFSIKTGWAVCTPETAGDFSAVGFHFGEAILKRTGVPIGLIDNAYGGSSCEAWLPPEEFENKEMYAEMLVRWEKTRGDWDPEEAKKMHAEKMEKWQEARKKALAAERPVPRAPRAPRNPFTGQHMPGNMWYGRTMPILGYGVKGATWYQGESNSSRAFQYRDLFPKMIEHWRAEWGVGDFPFY